MASTSDSAVVASAYDTKGNGGRRIVRLSNGWLISALFTPSAALRFYKSTDNGTTWTQFTQYGFSGATMQVSISSVGTKVYAIFNMLSDTGVYWCSFDATTVSSNIATGGVLDTSIANGAGCSITSNPTGTELHACWTNRTNSYSWSSNIRYIKGTISAVDGSVTWGTVYQLTTENTTGFNIQMPTVVVATNNNIIITYVYSSTNFNGIGCHKHNGTSWAQIGGSTTGIYTAGAYTQSSPSAIFVPQSVNGLTNGRIWLVWHGIDSVDMTNANIRLSFSDDCGSTWSAMQKLTTGNANNLQFPSITCTKTNVIYLVCEWTNGNAIGFLIWNGSWSALGAYKSSVIAAAPSTVYDLSLVFTMPLFIYKDTAKVGFYGIWISATISVATGPIGNKSDKSNILTYAINTSDMSTITERINGVITGTRTGTSGQSLTLGLSQAQWDAIKYGKYKDATSNLNTLTINMGTETWTYTFNKILASSDDIASVIKAVQDSQTTMLPSVKAKLASAIRGKGGSVNDSDSFDNMVSAVETLANASSKKWATGSFADNNVINTIDLNFTPSTVLWGTDGINSNAHMGAYTDAIGSFKTYGKDIKPNIIYDNWSSSSDYGNIGIAYKYYNALSILSNQIKIRGFNGGGSTIRWIAIE
jgi:hypothetical protein